MTQAYSPFHLDVLQDQWLLLALFIATAMVLAFLLAYLTAWRRTQAPEGPGAPAAAPGKRRVPWVLLILYIITVAYMIMYVAMRVSNPPNW